MATTDEQPIDDVELHHQPEEPERPGPDDLIGRRQQVVEHEQLGHHVEQLVTVGARRHVVNHEEEHEAHNHHAEEFEVVEPAPARKPLPFGKAGRGCRGFIFLHQPIAAEEEEKGHAVVAEVGNQVDGQIPVWVGEHAEQPLIVGLGEGKLVLLDGHAQPVTVVMQHDTEDGYAAQG